MSWLVWRLRMVWFVGCGRLAGLVHGWVSPMFRLSMGSSDLWMCTKSAELETYSNGRVLCIRQVMVWTSHVDVEYGDLSSCPWLCYLYLDSQGYPLSYYHCYIYYYYYFCYAFTWSWHIYLLLYPELVRWDLRSMFVLTCLLLLCFNSWSWLCSRRRRVAGVLTQAVFQRTSYLWKVSESCLAVGHKP
jgi:hypothetical protein